MTHKVWFKPVQVVTVLCGNWLIRASPVWGMISTSTWDLWLVFVSATADAPWRLHSTLFSGRQTMKCLDPVRHDLLGLEMTFPQGLAMYLYLRGDLIPSTLRLPWQTSRWISLNCLWFCDVAVITNKPCINHYYFVCIYFSFCKSDIQL